MIMRRFCEVLSENGWIGKRSLSILHTYGEASASEWPLFSLAPFGFDKVGTFFTLAIAKGQNFLTKNKLKQKEQNERNETGNGRENGNGADSEFRSREANRLGKNDFLRFIINTLTMAKSKFEIIPVCERKHIEGHREIYQNTGWESSPSCFVGKSQLDSESVLSYFEESVISYV